MSLPRRLLATLALCLTTALPSLAKDELVVGMIQYPSTWNPLTGSMLAKSVIQNMTARPLTAWDPDWKLVCMLCVDLPTLENGKARPVELEGGKRGVAIAFTLKPDLFWGDGKPVTSRDVAFTVEVGKHPQSGAVAAEAFRRILRVEIADERTFTLVVDRLSYDYNDTGLWLLPEHVERPVFEANPAEYRTRTRYDADTTSLALYNGPFRIAQTTPGASIVLERNPAWRGQQPAFRKITVKVIENTAALEANLLSGSIDYAMGELGLSLEQALAFEKRHAAKYDFVYKPGLIHEHIDVNLDNPLLQDRRVRQALLLGIDRNAISTRLFEGKQAVAHSGVNPLDPMYVEPTRTYPYDPAAARALLDAAGFVVGAGGMRANAKGERLSIELGTTAGNRSREQIQQVLQSQWRQIGIDVRLKAEPPRVFFGETMNKRAFTGLALYAWVSRPGGVPRTTYHGDQIPSAANAFSGQNYPGYRDAAVDKLLDAMEAALDPAKRRAMFAELQGKLAEDLPVLPLFFRTDPFILPKARKGVRPTGHLNTSTLWIEQWRWAP